MSTIYAVFASSESNEYLLGYATGDVKDIAEWFDEKKGCGLRLKEVKPIHIDKDKAARLRLLKADKIRVSDELTKLTADITKMEYYKQ